MKNISFEGSFHGNLQLGAFIQKVSGSEIAPPFEVTVTEVLLGVQNSSFDISAAADAGTEVALALSDSPTKFGLFDITCFYSKADQDFSIECSLFLGENVIDLTATYDSETLWTFTGEQVMGQISLGTLLKDYLGWNTDQDLAVDGLAAMIETKHKTWDFTGRTAAPWEIAPLGLSVTGSLSMGTQLMENGSINRYGELYADVVWNNIQLRAFYNYDIEYSAYGITWGALTGKIETDKDSGHQVATLEFKQSVSLGEIVETMITWATGQKFGLAEPWDLLNEVNLGHLKLKYDFDDKTVSFGLAIDAVNLGIAEINGIAISYGPRSPGSKKKSVMIELDGSFAWQGSEQNEPLTWDAAEPDSTPVPEGHGNKYLDLRLLAMGQHVQLGDGTPFSNINAAIEAMRNLPDPEPGQLPTYHADSDWLFGADFGILKLKSPQKDGTHFIQMQAVFNDPRLYGLRLALAGPAAKVLAGLDFEIRYQKVGEQLGVYQAELTLPDRMRRISVGAFTLTMPAFAIEVFTNGDFNVDIGFPHNRNYEGSFTIEAIVPPGIPLLGSGGFYFGKLSSASSNAIPVVAADLGSFNPVLVFGFGMQVGLGKSFNRGILKAGFSLTFLGILEGVLAKWNPYQDALTAADAGQLQDGYYFRLRGTLGISGRFYGYVDFYIIKVEFSVGITLAIEADYRAYESMVLSVIVEVDVATKVTVTFVEIEKSFSRRIKETFTIENQGQAPWQLDDPRILNLRRQGPNARLWALQAGDFADIPFAPERETTTASKTPLKGYLTTGLTVLGDGAIPAAPGKVAMILIESIGQALPEDDTSARKARGETSDTSFEILCKQILRWMIAAAKDQTDLDQVDGEITNEAELKSIQNKLQRDRPISAADAESFMAAQFDFVLEAGAEPATDAPLAVFPVPGGLGIRYPAPDDADTNNDQRIAYTFGDYNSIDQDYLDSIQKYFNDLRVQFDEQDETGSTPVRDATEQSVASFVFADYFALIARQMVEFALDGLRNYKLPLNAGNTIAKLVETVNTNGGLTGPAALTPADLVTANAYHVLQTDATVAIGYQYPAAPGDSFTSIASDHFENQFNAYQILALNLANTDILKSGVEIEIGQPSKYIIQPGDSLATIVKESGLPLLKLLNTSDILTLAPIFAADAKLDLPLVQRLTGAPTSFNSIAREHFAGRVTASALARLNGGLDILQPGATLTLTLQGSSTGAISRTIRAGELLIDIATDLKIALNDLLNEILDQNVIRPLATLMVPAFDHEVVGSETFDSLSARYGLSLANLARGNVDRPDLFDTSDPYLDVPHLGQYRVGDLIQEIQATLGLHHLSGMVSNYSLSGLRLPTAGITPRSRGMWVDEELRFQGTANTAGLYALTGQQFPVPGQIDAAFAIGFQAAQVPWLSFTNKSQDATITIQPDTKTARAIEALSDYLSSNKFLDTQSNIQLASAATYSAPEYALEEEFVWQAAGALQLAYGTESDTHTFSVRRVSRSLTGLTRGRKAASFVPRVALTTSYFDDASSTTREQSVKNYSWATQVAFTVKRILAIDSSPNTQTTYEIESVRGEDLPVLEQLLAQQSEKANNVAGLMLCFTAPVANQTRADTSTNTATGNTFQSDTSGTRILSIVRANLSTTTRAPTRPTKTTTDTDDLAIQNPISSIRSLWQAGNTNQGGFFLYYSDPAGTAGLPDWIFNDQGEAHVRMVILYEPTAASDQNRVRSYLNAVVTDSLSRPGRHTFARIVSESLPMPDANLTDIAREYFADLGQIAADNQEQKLNPANALTITGGSFLVQASMTAGNTLSSIAKHFNTNVDAIVTANPGRGLTPQTTQLAEFFALNLPEIQHTPGTTPGGSTLGEIAAYYNTGVSRIVADNQNHSDFFSPGEGDPATVLRTGPVEVRSNIQAGVLSVETTRLVPQEPGDDPNAPDFARNLLLTNFSLLQYNLTANHFFRASKDSIPIGPLVKGAPVQQDKIRFVRQLTAGKDYWHYHQNTPYSRFVGGDANANATENLYAGIDTLLQCNYAWLDIYGNSIASDLTEPGSDGRPNSPRLIRPGYSDALVGPAEWPAVSLDWELKTNPANQPALYLNFHFDPDAFANSSAAQSGEAATKTAGALKTYRRVLQQLQDPNGIAFGLSTSLLEKEIDLSATATPLISWLAEIEKFLSDSVTGNSVSSTAPSDPVIVHTIDLTDLNTASDIYKLNLNFNIRRKKDRVFGGLGGMTGVIESKTTVSPYTGNQIDPKRTLETFAANFESTLQSVDCVYKLTTGLDRRNAGVPSGSQDLWVVRLGRTGTANESKNADAGIAFDIQSEARVFARRPISNELQNRYGLKVYTYNTADGLVRADGGTDFIDVDIDIWAKQFFRAFDELLAPKNLAAIQILAEHFGSDHLASLAEAKSNLAGSLAQLLIPVVAASDESDQTKAANANKPTNTTTDRVQELFCQELLIRLSNLETTRAAVAWETKVQAYFADDAPVRLVGEMIHDGNSANTMLTSPKLELAPQDPASQGHAPLAFLITSNDLIKGKTDEVLAAINLDLSYQVSAIEHQVGSLPDIEGYRPSSWLGFITENRPASLTKKLNPVKVPLTLDAYPDLPSLLLQTGKPSAFGQPLTDLGDATFWDYTFTYSQSFHYPQDTIVAEVRFDSLAPDAVEPAEDLFGALADFRSSYAAIQNDFNKYLSQVNAAAGASVLKNAHTALKAFNQLTENIVAATAPAKTKGFTLPQRTSGSNGNPFDFQIRETAATATEQAGRLIVTVTATGGWSESVPVPVVMIAGFTTVADPANPDEGPWSYSFKKDDESGEYLPAARAQTIKERTVALRGMNIFEYQQARAQIHVSRNEELIPGSKTAPPFIFTTNPIAFDKFYQADITVNDLIDISKIKASADSDSDSVLAKYIQNMLNSLFENSDRTSVRIQMSVNYKYAINPGLGLLQLPILLQPPLEYTSPAAGSISELARDMAAAINKWIKDKQVPTTGSQLDFEIIILSSAAEPMPLLRLSNLTLGVEHFQK